MYGWIANIILIVATWSMSPRRKWPFFGVFVGECLWVGVSWEIGRWDMVFICVVFAILALRNFFKWMPHHDPA